MRLKVKAPRQRPTVSHQTSLRLHTHYLRSGLPKRPRKILCAPLALCFTIECFGGIIASGSDKIFPPSRSKRDPFVGIFALVSRGTSFRCPTKRFPMYDSIIVRRTLRRFAAPPCCRAKVYRVLGRDRSLSRATYFPPLHPHRRRAPQALVTARQIRGLTAPILR